MTPELFFMITTAVMVTATIVGAWHGARLPVPAAYPCEWRVNAAIGAVLGFTGGALWPLVLAVAAIAGIGVCIGWPARRLR